MTPDKERRFSSMEDRPEQLAQWYTDARMLALRTQAGVQRIPYTVEFSYIGRTDLFESWGYAEVLERQYRFPVELTGYKEHIYAKYPSQIARPDDHGAVCPRVQHFFVSNAGNPRWKIEFANYADQVGTNMYPDELLSPPIRVDNTTTDATCVRELDQLLARCPNRLPSFDASRLSNTIGVSVGIMAKREDGREVVLWRRRSLEVRIYPGMPATPLSFALNLPIRDWHGSQALRDLVFADYNAERAEELGVEQHLFSPLMPLAFCRDLPRAGKPQLFLEKRSWIPFEQLRAHVVQNSAEWIGDLQALDVGAPPPADASPELLAYLALRQMAS